jgi:transcriptional regulator with XRE-family HTH domain
MITSQTTTLFKLAGDDKISLGTFGYLNGRTQQRAYSLVIREFKKSGLSQAALAARLGKGADVVSRLLRRPRNWELNTFSELLFAISGAVPTFGVTYPLDQTDATAKATLIKSKPTVSTESLTLSSTYGIFDPRVATRKLEEAA